MKNNSDEDHDNSGDIEIRRLKKDLLVSENWRKVSDNELQIVLRWKQWLEERFYKLVDGNEKWLVEEKRQRQI